MTPIQPFSTRLNQEQRATLKELAAWLNWSESDVIRYCITSIHEICQQPDGEIPVIIRMAREGRQNYIGVRNKPGISGGK
jgi:hypothetical protein